jgi:hypothetical protein
LGAFHLTIEALVPKVVGDAASSTHRKSADQNQSDQ